MAPCVQARDQAGDEGRRDGGSTVAAARSAAHGWITLARAPTRVRFDATGTRPMLVLSERATAHRNRAIAHLLRYFEVLEAPVEASSESIRQAAPRAGLRTTPDLSALAASGLRPSARRAADLRV